MLSKPWKEGVFVVFVALGFVVESQINIEEGARGVGWGGICIGRFDDDGDDHHDDNDDDHDDDDDDDYDDDEEEDEDGDDDDDDDEDDDEYGGDDDFNFILSTEHLNSSSV